MVLYLIKVVPAASSVCISVLKGSVLVVQIVSNKFRLNHGNFGHFSNLKKKYINSNFLVNWSLIDLNSAMDSS